MRLVPPRSLGLVVVLFVLFLLWLIPIVFLLFFPSPYHSSNCVSDTRCQVSSVDPLSVLLDDQLSVSVAWAIPVGGRTQRLDRLQSLLRDLIAQGAGRQHIYVFEDDGSRDSASPALAAICRAWGVTLIQTHIQRKHPEPGELFGLHLARHYHYMLDTILLPEDNDVLQSLIYTSETKQHMGYSFIVLVEDDLHLAPDAVHYFHSMSRVMDMDNSLLCVCAHADNAFYAETRSETELLMLHHHHHINRQAAASQQTRYDTGVIQATKKDQVRNVEATPMLISVDGIESFLVDDDEDQQHKQHPLTPPQSPPQHLSSSRPDSSLLTLSASEFDFRRGQHFMAPGWMTSARIYRAIRGSWFDSQLNLPHRVELNMPNGNWDAFFDSQAHHLGLECIFPEIPRVAHVGANGYTVSAAMQAELFDNLRLSSLPPTIDYGDLTRLTLDQYDRHLLAYIKTCTRVFTYDEIALYRRSSLCLLLPTGSDKDGLWVDLFSNYFGSVSIGGHANYGKQRGIHHGAVFNRWMTNLILIIGAHGQLAQSLIQLHSNAKETEALQLLNKEAGIIKDQLVLDNMQVPDHYLGCFADDRNTRLLPLNIGSISPITPLRCMFACSQRGGQYAGIEWGWECWCGGMQGRTLTSNDSRSDFLRLHRQQIRPEQSCDSRCVSNWEEKMNQARNRDFNPDKQNNNIRGCGGDFMLSVYSTIQPDTDTDATQQSDSLMKHLHPRPITRLPDPFADVTLLIGAPGANCADTCAASTPSSVCDDALLALIHQDCTLLQQMLGCSTCIEPATPWDGFAAPGQQRMPVHMNLTGGEGQDAQAKLLHRQSPCVLSRGKYLRCSALPREANFVRACVCVKPDAALT